jgi:hypothetical protein
MNGIVRGIIHRRTNRKGLIDSRQISVFRDDGFLPDGTSHILDIMANQIRQQFGLDS